MLKRLAIVIFGATLLFGWPCMAQDHLGQPHAATDKTDKDHRVIQQTSLIVDPPIAAPCTQAKPCYGQENAPEKPLPRPIRPEWIIVYITTVYVFISGWTLLAIKRQARTMNRQTDLQGIAYTQWVVVKNWRSKLIDEETPALYSDGSPVIRMRLQVDIVNESQFPLTLVDSIIVFRISGGETEFTVRFMAPQNFPLFPHVPYVVDVVLIPAQLNAKMIRDGGYLFARVEGSLDYIGVLKRPENYPLHGTCFVESLTRDLMPKYQTRAPIHTQTETAASKLGHHQQESSHLINPPRTDAGPLSRQSGGKLAASSSPHRAGTTCLGSPTSRS